MAYTPASDAPGSGVGMYRKGLPFEARAPVADNTTATVAVEIAMCVLPVILSCLYISTEWARLSATNKQRVQTDHSMGTVNIAGTNTRACLAAAFANGAVSRRKHDQTRSPRVPRAVSRDREAIG